MLFRSPNVELDVARSFAEQVIVVRGGLQEIPESGLELGVAVCEEIRRGA
jgi:hypothetical protein